jgi:hypothetical protein
MPYYAIYAINAKYAEIFEWFLSFIAKNSFAREQSKSVSKLKTKTQKKFRTYNIQMFLCKQEKQNRLKSVFKLFFQEFRQKSLLQVNFFS